MTIIISMVVCNNCNALIPDDVVIFCPECGEKNMDVKRILANMRTSKAARLWVQTTLAFVPLANIVAARRVGKLKRSLLVYLAIIIPLWITGAIIYTYFSTALIPDISYYDYGDTMSQIPYFESNVLPILLTAIWIWLASSVTMAYFLIKWSKKWNREIRLRELVLRTTDD